LSQQTKRLASYTAPAEVYEDLVGSDDEVDPFLQRTGSRRIVDRQSEYHSRRLNRAISPDRNDPFAENESKGESRTYVDVMREAELEREEQRVIREIEKKKKEAEKKAKEVTVEQSTTQKKRRWDMETPAEIKATSEWSKADDESSVGKSRWDETPRASEDIEMDTPRKRSRWDVTPQVSAKKSRWDETPTHPAVPIGATPVGNLGLLTPTPGHLVPMTPEGKHIKYLLFVVFDLVLIFIYLNYSSTLGKRFRRS
jgi:splicing factor 3B subunit 1